VSPQVHRTIELLRRIRQRLTNAEDPKSPQESTARKGSSKPPANSYCKSACRIDDQFSAERLAEERRMEKEAQVKGEEEF
jgi:hypothetical protein